MSFAGFDFAAGEFPTQGMRHGLAALRGKKKTASNDERGDDFDRFHDCIFANVSDFIVMLQGVALKTSATDFGKVTGRRVEDIRDRF